MQTAKLAQNLLRVGLLTRWGFGWPHRHLTPVLLGLLLLAKPAAVVAQTPAGVVSSWKFDPVTNQLEITVQQGTQVDFQVVNQPPRIVIDISNTILGGNPIRQIYSGLVRQFLVSQIQGGKTRLVMEFAPGVPLDASRVQIEQAPALVEDGAFRQRWILRPLIAVMPETGNGDLSAFLTPPAATVNSLPPSTGPSNLPSGPVVDRGQQMPEAVPLLIPTWRSPLPALSNSSPLSGSGEGEMLPNDRWVPPSPSVSVTVPPLDRPSGTPSSSLPSLPVPPPNPPGLGSLAYGYPSLPSWNDESDSASGVLLKSGTRLVLRYSGRRGVRLDKNAQWQEVLLLDEPVRDRRGNTIPAGTQVLGRFETNGRGTQFIAQAISLLGRNVPLVAKSNRLRDVFELEPGQIVEIELKEDLE